MGWVEQALEVQEQGYKKLNAEADANSLSTPLRDKAPGWIFKGIEISCVPSETYPWDPKVVRAIQKVAPDIVPIWVKYIYEEPNDWGNPQTHVIGRHGLGAVNKSPHSERNPFPCRMPDMPCQGVYFERPNQVEWIFKGIEDPRAKDLPGAYVPFDWDIYRFVRESYRRLTFSEIKEKFLDRDKERHEATLASRQEYIAYMQKDLRAYAKKRMGEVSEVEMKEYFLATNRKKAPNPKVFLG